MSVDPCACLCRANHPDKLDICTVHALVTVSSASGIELPMCPACATEWGRPRPRTRVRLAIWEGITVSRSRSVEP